MSSAPPDRYWTSLKIGTKREAIAIAVIAVLWGGGYLWTKYENTVELTCTNEEKQSVQLVVNYTSKMATLGPVKCPAVISETEVSWGCTQQKSDGGWVRLILNRNTGYMTANVKMTPYLCEKPARKF